MNHVIRFLLILNLLNETSIQGNTYIIGAGEGYDANKVGENETEVVIPLKHLSNFWRSLNISLINCEVELILTWSKNCVLVYMTVNVTPSGATFKITDTNCMFQLLLCQKKMTQNF